MNDDKPRGKFSRRKLLSIGGVLAALGIGGGFLYDHFSSTSPVKVESFMTQGNGDKKNILVMTGSSRNGGNSEILASAFIDGAKKAGHTVNVFHSGKTPIAACMHCDGCWITGKPCVQNDAFESLWPMLEQADMLVFCSPLYWYNFSGHLKCAIDRMYPYSRKNRLRNMKVKEAVLLMCGESMFLRSFAGPAEAYRQMLGYKGWKDRGRLFVTGVNEFGAMKNHDALERAREMGLLA